MLDNDISQITQVNLCYPIEAYQEESKAVKTYIIQCTNITQTALEWTIKKEFISNFEIKASRALKKNTEKLGLFFAEILHCCERMQTHQNIAEIYTNTKISQYNSATDRFLSIIREFSIFGIGLVFGRLYAVDKWRYQGIQSIAQTKEGIKETKDGAKKRCIYNHKKICELVSKYQVPDYLESDFSFFLNDAITLASDKRFTPFQTKYFKPLIKAWKILIDDVNSWKLVDIDRERDLLFAYAGAGKGKTWIDFTANSE